MKKTVVLWVAFPFCTWTLDKQNAVSSRQCTDRVAVTGSSGWRRPGCENADANVLNNKIPISYHQESVLELNETSRGS